MSLIIFEYEKFIHLVTSFLLIASNSLHSQNENAIAAAGVAIAGIAALASVESYKDHLELDAVEYVISTSLKT